VAIEGAILVTRAGHQEMALAKDFYAQDTDPGAVGAGSVWKDTGTFKWWARNVTNDGWEARFNPSAEAENDDEADVTADATAEDGDARADSTATTNNGAASANLTATAVIGGDASTVISATTASGAADAHQAATSDDGTADTTATSTSTTGVATSGVAVLSGDSEASLRVAATDGVPSTLTGTAAEATITAPTVRIASNDVVVGAAGDAALVLMTGGSDTAQLTVAGASLALDSVTGGLTITGSSVVIVGLPSSDPLVAGQLFTNGAPIAGVPQALMVSGGPP
jgi:hypothetical protein